MLETRLNQLLSRHSYIETCKLLAKLKNCPNIVIARYTKKAGNTNEGYTKVLTAAYEEIVVKDEDLVASKEKRRFYLMVDDGR